MLRVDIEVVSPSVLPDDETASPTVWSKRRQPLVTFRETDRRPGLPTGSDRPVTENPHGVDVAIPVASAVAMVRPCDDRAACLVGDDGAVPDHCVALEPALDPWAAGMGGDREAVCRPPRGNGPVRLHALSVDLVE